MGTRNRERRRIKQIKHRKGKRKDSQGQGRQAGSTWHTGLGDTALDMAIFSAAHAGCEERPTHIDREDQVRSLAEGLGLPRGRQLVANRVTAMMTGDLVQLLGAGWRPDDLVRVIRRQAGAAAASVALGPVTEAICRHRRKGHDHASVDRVDLAGEARVLEPNHPSWHTNLSAAIDALGVMEHLPALPDLGSFGSPRRGTRSAREERVLTRIRALLAKAESSDFFEEADAFMAKAQQLMTHHCVDRALLDESLDPATGSRVEARRIWLEDPYLQAKALLLAEVAGANRCRAVVSPRLGFSTVVGFPADLEATELLFTSLLVQATRRLTALGHEPVHGRRSRRPSYRRSFLAAYSGRIGARLREANSVATVKAHEALGHRLLPVLAKREDEVDAAMRSLFADLGSFDLSITDYAGWAAGSAAADMADLAVQDTLPDMAAS